MTTHTSVRRALVAVAGVAFALLSAGHALASGPVQTGDDHHKNQFSLTESATQCDTSTGKWRVTWTLENEWNRDATITEVESQPAGDVTVGDPAVPLAGAVVPQKDRNIDGQLTATQVLPGDAKSAQLSFTVVWSKEQGKPNDGATKKVSETVRLKGTCQPTEKCVTADAAKYAHTFAVSGSSATSTIKLAGDLPLCAGQSQSFLLVSYYAPSASATWPQYKYDSVVGVIDADHPTVDLGVDIPACFTQVDLVWGDKLINPMVANGERYNDRKLGSGGAPGNRSKGPQAWYNGGSKACVTPDATMVSACDGTVTVHLTNAGADAKYDAPFKVVAGLDGSFVKEVTVQPGKSVDVLVPAEKGGKVTVSSGKDFVAEGMWQPGHCALPTVTSESTCDSFTVSVTNPEGNLPADATVRYGDQSKNLTVQPGRTEKVTFAAGDATEATVSFPDFDKEVTLVYTKPSDCASGTPSPRPTDSPGVPGSETPSPSTSTGTPGLPVTGVQVGLIAGVAALLLGGGAVLLIGARRRKLTDVE
ncbi:MAG: cell wall anchor protein [Hamadaea sp.]|uniref:cell wall anchor protein n=1 Tax=Hamadaea sp. TaxID=2024425 RepID=UPI0018366139|nr:cell wall anchor protein [Hamadaea sp.]NUR72687.1 cell wall anchor protein [Hamadaea sp.]NUT20124.1 cell wall anchor protein [Hamadaea sp.]